VINLPSASTVGSKGKALIISPSALEEDGGSRNAWLLAERAAAAQIIEERITQPVGLEVCDFLRNVNPFVLDIEEMEDLSDEG